MRYVAEIALTDADTDKHAAVNLFLAIHNVRGRNQLAQQGSYRNWYKVIHFHPVYYREEYLHGNL